MRQQVYTLLKLMKLHMKPFGRMLYGQMTQNVAFSIFDIIQQKRQK